MSDSRDPMSDSREPMSPGKSSEEQSMEWERSLYDDGDQEEEEEQEEEESAPHTESAADRAQERLGSAMTSRQRRAALAAAVDRLALESGGGSTMDGDAGHDDADGGAGGVAADPSRVREDTAFRTEMPNMYKWEDSLRDESISIPKDALYDCGDELIGKWIERVRGSSGRELVDVAHELLRVDKEATLDVEKLDVKAKRETHRVMALYYRFCSEGIVDPTSPTSVVGQRFVRMIGIIDNLKEAVRLHHQTRVLSDQTQDTDQSSLLRTFRFISDTEKTSACQKLILHMLRTAARYGYRKQGKRLYRQVMTKPRPGQHKSYRTRAWEPAMDIKEFVYQTVSKEANNGEQWFNFTDSKGNASWCETYLENCFDYELPYLSTDRHIFSFSTGVYDAQLNRYYEYSDEGNVIPPNTVASKYFDMPFDYETFCACDDWRDVPTPYFEKIIEPQQFHEEVKDWIYVFVGRCIYDLGEHDTWQCIPFFKGRAGTGKSTINKVASNFYMPVDVGTLSNNLEKKFGLSQLANKNMFVCMEVKADFGVDQGEFQSMVSGEQMAMPVKNNDALCKEWSAPGLLAGNESAAWVDNSGSVSRRVVVFSFDKAVRVMDPRLFDNLSSREMGALIYKCNVAYRTAAIKYGTTDIWKALPKYFKDTQKALRGETHTLAAFLNAEESIVIGEDYLMAFSEFKDLVHEFASANTLPKAKFGNSAANATVLEQYDIKVDAKPCMRTGTNGSTAKERWVLGVTARSALNDTE